jgi:hypothetical protein
MTVSPFFKKIGGMPSTSFDTIPKTQTLAGNLILDPTGTSSGSWARHLLFVIPAVHKSLHIENFLLRKNSENFFNEKFFTIWGSHWKSSSFSNPLTKFVGFFKV